MVTLDEIQRIVDDALNSAISEPWEVSRHAAERILALTATASAEPVVTEDAHQFKNFHRLLCERFGYCHDEKDWRRDQVSLIEHIAALTATASAKPVAYTSQAQLDRLAEGKGGIIWSEPLPYLYDIELYAAAISGGDNAK